MKELNGILRFDRTMHPFKPETPNFPSISARSNPATKMLEKYNQDAKMMRDYKE